MKKLQKIALTIALLATTTVGAQAASISEIKSRMEAIGFSPELQKLEKEDFIYKFTDLKVHVQYLFLFDDCWKTDETGNIDALCSISG